MNSVHHLPLVVGRVSPAAKTSQKSTWRFPKMENQPSEKPSIKPGCSHPKRKIHNYKWFKWWYFMDFPLTMPFGVAEFQQTSMVSRNRGPPWTQVVASVCSHHPTGGICIQRHHLLGPTSTCGCWMSTQVYYVYILYIYVHIYVFFSKIWIHFLNQMARLKSNGSKPILMGE